MARFINFLTNLFFVFIFNLSNFIFYALFLGVVSFTLVQAWLFYSSHFLIVSSYNEWLLVDPGYLCFAIFWLLLISDLFKFEKLEITFTSYYLNCFSKPEKAIQWWLCFRFYLASILSCFLVYTSFKSQINLCSIDAYIAFPTSSSWETLYSWDFLKFLCLTAVTLFLHFLAKKYNTNIVFLQALLLTTASGALTLANCLNFYQLSMLNFYSAFLLLSCLACLIAFIDKCFQRRLEKLLQKWQIWLSKLDCGNSYFFQSKKAQTEKSLRTNTWFQYIRSYLLFVTCSNFLYWSLLFNSSFSLIFSQMNQSDNKAFYAFVVGFLFVTLWLFLAFGFLRIAACISNNEKLPWASLPLVPFLLLWLYLSPLYAILIRSWFAVEKENLLRKIYTVLFHPTLGLKIDASVSSLKNISQGSTVICSPQENTVLPSDTATYVGWMLKGIGNLVDQQRYSRSVATARLTVEKMVQPARSVVEQVGPESEIGQTLNAGIQKVIQAQKLLNTEQETAQLVNGASGDFSKGAFLIQSEYSSCCPSSPRTGLIRPEQNGLCFSNYASFLKSFRALEENKDQPSASSVLEFIEKAF